MYLFNEINTQSFADRRKAEFYGTVNSDGTPHITLINSMYRLDDDTLVWGEYCHGYSKINQIERPNVTILALDEQQRLEYGHATYHHSKSSGEIFDVFNTIPRYRYNNIFGYSPIHFLKITDWGECMLNEDANKRMASSLAAEKIHPGVFPDAFSVLTRQIFSSPFAFKVIGWTDKEGIVHMAPLPQCCLTTGSRVVFAFDENETSLLKMPEGATSVVFCLDLQRMFCVLVRGEYRNVPYAKSRAGVVEVNSVYNPMMPKNCYIFPRTPLQPVRHWEGALHEYNV